MLRKCPTVVLLASLLVPIAAFSPFAKWTISDDTDATKAHIEETVRLSRASPPRESLFAGARFSLSPSNGTNTNSSCTTRPSFDRVITLAATLNLSASPLLQFDTHRLFATSAVGIAPADVQKFEARSLELFSTDFQIPPSKFVFPTSLTPGEEPSSKLAFIPFVYSTPYYIVADSDEPVSCPETYALWGGYLATGKNVTVSGQFYRDTIVLFQSALVFAPGTPSITRLRFRSQRPLACTPAGCTISNFVLSFDNSIYGDVDGVLQVDAPATLTTRLVMSFPGRIPLA